MFKLNSDFGSGADIRIMGIGSSGINAINSMIESGLDGVDFIALNTDAQSLQRSKARTNLQIGEKITFGLGTGGNIEKGICAIEQSKDEVVNVINGADLLFLTTGLGGGTGTGCIHKVAEYARELGILAIAVVTKPFSFEGMKKMRIAKNGVELLKKYADTVITIPNDRLLQTTDSNIPMLEAFKLADAILYQGVQSIIELVHYPALINLDFADLRTVIQSSGNAMIGIGMEEGDNSVVNAAKKAIESPLLEVPFAGASRVLLNICSDESLSLFDVDKASKMITAAASPDANIIFGATINPEFKGRTKVVVIATGFGEIETERSVEKPSISKSSYVDNMNRKETDNSNLDIPAFLRRRG
ncbi:cell division protein FtsZ [bacterium]|nr:cell division protein FtsZ [bacterium]